MRDDDWRPSASTKTLVARAQTLIEVRAFFAQRGVLEVDTPILSRTTVTEPAIDSLSLGDGAERRYLQTSPEYHMKRMLAAGAPSIVRIWDRLRAEESGRLHNPEFTMVEWYRLGFDLPQLIDEVAALVDLVLGAGRSRRVTYRQLLIEGAGVDPMRSTDVELTDSLLRCGVELSANADVTAARPAGSVGEPCDRSDGLRSRVHHGLSGRPGRVGARDAPDATGFDVAQRFELGHRRRRDRKRLRRIAR